MQRARIRTTHEFYGDCRVKVTPVFGSAISGAAVLNVTTLPVRPVKVQKNVL